MTVSQEIHGTERKSFIIKGIYQKKTTKGTWAVKINSPSLLTVKDA